MVGLSKKRVVRVVLGVQNHSKDNVHLLVSLGVFVEFSTEKNIKMILFIGNSD